ncbi:MAG TPA: hypothetical protein VMC48_00520 [Methanobacterium sp.]|nr:hypothetical protein [Methanobacterium sp.]
MADNIIFRRGTGSKQKDKQVLEVNEDNITLQNRRENALIISFNVPEEEIVNIHDYFDGLDEHETVAVEIANAGEVEYYFRGISPVKDEDGGLQKLSVTLQLKREFL